MAEIVIRWSAIEMTLLSELTWHGFREAKHTDDTVRINETDFFVCREPGKQKAPRLEAERAYGESAVDSP